MKGADGLWAVQNIRSAHSRSADIDTKFTQPNWKLHDIGTGSTLEPWLKAMLAAGGQDPDAMKLFGTDNTVETLSFCARGCP